MHSDITETRFACAKCGKELYFEKPPDNELTAEMWMDALRMTRSLVKGLLCDPCYDRIYPAAIQHEGSHVIRKSKSDLEIERWIPPTYRDSDIDRFPVAQYKIVNLWQPGPEGLFLFGPSRRFKSRLAYWVALGAIRLGHKVMAFDSRTFRAEVETRIMSGKLWDWYPEVERAQLLLLDDLGKFKGEGKRIEEELFNVVKCRVEAQQSIIITTNDTPQQLSRRFSDSIAGPIIERIRETCTLVSFYTRSEAEHMRKQKELDLTGKDL